MIAYCEGFIFTINEQLPPSILLAAYEMPKYDKLSIKARPIITAQDESQAPMLFEQAIKAGLIDAEIYEAEKARLFKNHGLVI